MSLKKTATVEEPHATFMDSRGGWTWKVLKVYCSAKADRKDPYARWFLGVQSPHLPPGEYEMGDTYIRDVLQYGQLTSATDEFKAYFEELNWVPHV